MYTLAVKHLGRLPYEVFPDAPQHQIMFAIAMLDLEAEERAKIIKKEFETARTPAKWRKVHANLDRAAAALSHLN